MAVQLGVAAVGAGMSYFQGKQMEKSAMDKINNFKWQEQNNPYKNLAVSTKAADFQREENARFNAQAVEALRAGGARAIGAGMGSVVAGTNEMNRRISADLDEQQKAIDMAAAGDDVRYRDMVERRQADELAGYSNLMNVGMGMKYQGINQLVNTLGSASAQWGAAKAEGDTGWGAILGFGKRTPQPPATPQPY